MSNNILDDIEKGRRAYDAMPAYDEGADYTNELSRIAAALERIADCLERKVGEAPG